VLTLTARLELGQSSLRVGHSRLQLGVRVLPKLDEFREVRDRLLAVTLCVVQLAQSLVRSRESLDVVVEPAVVARLEERLEMRDR
jgi:hypothetical protein